MPASPFHDELVAHAVVIDGHADVLGMLGDAGIIRRATDALAEPFGSSGITKVAGLEARGFIFAAAVALKLGAGFVPVRKPGGIHPGLKERVVTRPDWPGLSLLVDQLTDDVRERLAPVHAVADAAEFLGRRPS